MNCNFLRSREEEEDGKKSKTGYEASFLHFAEAKGKSKRNLGSGEMVLEKFMKNEM